MDNNRTAGTGTLTDVIVGNAVGGGGNVARFAALQAGLPVTVPGITVDRQCGSGLDAIVLASRLVAAGGNGCFLPAALKASVPRPAGPTGTTTASPTFSPGPALCRRSFGDPDMGVAAENVARGFRRDRERQDGSRSGAIAGPLTAASAGTFTGEIVPLRRRPGDGGFRRRPAAKPDGRR